MKKAVFYSWQSDLPNSTNRGFIEIALRDAAKEIASDESIDIDPVIDRDTQGVSGAPDIATTIFGKIATADIFVADISIVMNGRKRSTPNPNVLIELGYALKALGHERIILVFNEAFGDKRKLPFDLKMRRILTYKTNEVETNHRSEIKANLVRDLKAALVSGFSHGASLKPTVEIIDVIKDNLPSKKIELREYLTRFLVDLEKTQPPMMRDGGTVEDLITSLPKTENMVVEFSKLLEAIVLMNDMESAKEVFKWFGKLLARYYPPANEAGRTSNADGDFFKFVGHELFVAFIAPFLREEKWEDLGKFLNETLKMGPTKYNENETREGWFELSVGCPLLIDEGRRIRRESLRADILKERHESDNDLSKVGPFRSFSEADFFLYLHGPKNGREEFIPEWYPQSVLWLNHTPNFVLEAVDYPTAMKVCNALAIDGIEELKKRLTYSRKLRYAWIPPVKDEDIKNIGSEGGAVFVPKKP